MCTQHTLNTPHGLSRYVGMLSYTTWDMRRPPSPAAAHTVYACCQKSVMLHYKHAGCATQCLRVRCTAYHSAPGLIAVEQAEPALRWPHHGPGPSGLTVRLLKISWCSLCALELFFRPYCRHRALFPMVGGPFGSTSPLFMFNCTVVCWQFFLFMRPCTSQF